MDLALIKDYVVFFFDYGALGVLVVVLLLIGYWGTVLFSKVFNKVHNDFMDGQKELVTAFKSALAVCEKDRERQQKEIDTLKAEVRELKMRHRNERT